MLARRSVPGLLLMALLLTGCGPKDVVLTPQAKVAKYGGDVMASIKVVAQTAASLEAQKTLDGRPVLPTAAAAQVMIACNQAAQTGKSLSILLTAYDALTTSAERAVAAGELQKALLGLDATMVQVQAVVQANPAASQVADLAANVIRLILQIRVAVGLPTTLQEA